MEYPPTEIRGRVEHSRMFEVCELVRGGPMWRVQASFCYLAEAYRYALGQGAWFYVCDASTKRAVRDVQRYTLADVAKALGHG